MTLIFFFGGGGGGGRGEMENCAYLRKNPGYAPDNKKKHKIHLSDREINTIRDRKSVV